MFDRFNPFRFPEARGYTLVELLIVIGLLGLAGSLVVPRLMGKDTMNVQAVVRMIISDLSFAQSDALSHQEYRRVVFFEDGNGYAIVRVSDADFNDAFDPETADYVHDPLTIGASAHAYIVDFTASDRFEGISIGEVAIDGEARQVTYDQLGGTIMGGNNPGLGGHIDVASATETYRISIAPFTGKLTVQLVEAPDPES